MLSTDYCLSGDLTTVDDAVEWAQRHLSWVYESHAGDEVEP